MMQKKTREEFISDAIGIHGTKYDYSLVVYNGSKIKVKIICSEHGVFEQTPNSHLKGRGCPIYSHRDFNASNSKEFVVKANIIHNNVYDYSLIEYFNSWTKIEIVCPKHGVFKQNPADHLSGNGCPKCGYEKNALTIRGNRMVRLFEYTRKLSSSSIIY